MGYGWKDHDELVTTKIESIFNRPQRSFKLYHTLFKQIKEFIPEFELKTMVKTYQQTERRKLQTALISFLSLKGNVLEIRYCIPLVEDIGIASTKTNAYLRSLFFDLP